MPDTASLPDTAFLLFASFLSSTFVEVDVMVSQPNGAEW